MSVPVVCVMIAIRFAFAKDGNAKKLLGDQTLSLPRATTRPKGRGKLGLNVNRFAYNTSVPIRKQHVKLEGSGPQLTSRQRCGQRRSLRHIGGRPCNERSPVLLFVGDRAFCILQEASWLEFVLIFSVWLTTNFPCFGTLLKGNSRLHVSLGFYAPLIQELFLNHDKKALYATLKQCSYIPGF